MSLDWSLVTPEALAALNIEKILASATEREVLAYSSVLAPMCADETRQPAELACLKFLQGMLQMMLRHAHAQEPFGPMFVFGGQRSWIPADVPKELLVRLHPWAATIEDAELRARLLDVIWMQGRHFSATQGAVRAYVAASKLHPGADDWYHAEARLERALRLAAGLGKGGLELKGEVLAEIQAIVDQPDDGTPLRRRLIDLLLEFNHGDPAALGTLAAAIGTAANSKGQFFQAKDSHALAADCFAKAGDDNARKRAQRAAAEALASEAGAALQRPGQGALAAASLMGDAVTAMRQAGATERAAQMHAQMLEWQTQSLAELREVSTRVDVSEHTRRAIKSVRGKPFRDAVLTFCGLTGPLPLDTLRSRVHKDAQTALIGGLSPLSVINYRGRVVAIIPPLDASIQDVSNDGLRGRMYHQARKRRDMNTAALLEPALWEIRNEHHPSRHDIVDLIRHSASIPKGHLESFIRALMAGFDGDMLLVAHLVPPQFEAMLRHVMEGMGADTSILGPTGLQPERIFKPLLELDEAKAAFGEDAVFEMQDVFIDTLGSNLRNEALHGLMPDEAMFSTEVFYAWWLLLRYCVLSSPLLRQQTNQAQPPAAPEAPSAAPSEAPPPDEGAGPDQSPTPDKG